jgi:enediyne biosynthesis protein E4
MRISLPESFKRHHFHVNLLIYTAIILSASTVCADPSKPHKTPLYFEEINTSEIDHTYKGGFRYQAGGGVATFDCNGDALPEIFLPGGTEPAALFLNVSQPGKSLHFEKIINSQVTKKSVLGAYPIDIDGDGVIDLAILRHGENILFRGLGNCRFERANEKWNFDGRDHWSTSFSAVWEKGQDWPTLAIGNYIYQETDPEGWNGCLDNVLHRPSLNGKQFGKPVLLKPGYCVLSMLFSDWNRDGVPDLRVSNDREYYKEGEEQLWYLELGKPPHLYTREEGWRKLEVYGMGIAGHDLSGDGYPEYYLTNMVEGKLQMLSKDSKSPEYEDAADKYGVRADYPFVGGDPMPSTSWHAEFQDVNNDSFIDLFVVKGNVDSMPEFASADPNNLLIGQSDGSFRESAEEANILSYSRGRGAALVDLNLDGMLDLVVCNFKAPVQLWSNATKGDAGKSEFSYNWLRLMLQQTEGNRNAIGSWVEVRTGEKIQRREITIGGGHGGGQLGWIHFGLGNEEFAEVRIQWPDGHWGSWVSVTANTFNVIESGLKNARVWQPGG